MIPTVPPAPHRFRRSRQRAHRAPWWLVATAGAVGLLLVAPLVGVVYQAFQASARTAHRVLTGPLLPTLLVAHHPAHRHRLHRLRRAGPRRGVAGRAHRPAVPPGLRGAAPAAARGAGVRRRLRLGVAGAVDPGALGRFAGDDAGALPARLPAGRGLAPAQRPRPRRGGPRPRASGPARRFVRVTLPQVSRPLVGGMLLVGLYLLAEYGAFAILRFRTFATAIYTQYTLGFDAQAASILTLVLCLIGVILLMGESRVGRSAHPGRESGRAPARTRLGRATPLAVLALLALCGLAIGVPVARSSTGWCRGTSTTLPPASVCGITVQSLTLGGVAAAVATALGAPGRRAHGAPPQHHLRRRRASRVPRPGPARRGHRPHAGDRGGPPPRAPLPDHHAARGGVRRSSSSPRPRRGARPRSPGSHRGSTTRPGRSARRRSTSCAASRVPAGPSRPGRGRNDGVAVGHHRAHGHPAAAPHRPGDARHAVLGVHHRPRIRRRSPLRGHHDRRVRAPRPAARPSRPVVVGVPACRRAA